MAGDDLHKYKKPASICILRECWTDRHVVVCCYTHLVLLFVSADGNCSFMLIKA